MKVLSRNEEMLLLAVWRLQDDAYGATIRKQLNEVTGKKWTLGALYVTLDRMTRKGLLETHFSDPEPVPGGRRKKMYRLRPAGKQALVAINRLQKSLWQGINLSDLVHQTR